MDLLAYKSKEDHFRIVDPTCGLRADRIVYRPGQILLVIDVTVLNAVTSDIKKKGKPTEEIMARKRADVKILKFQAVCAAMGQYSCLQLSSRKAVLERGSSNTLTSRS